MKIHNKLVRDKIPQIIEASNKRPVFQILSDNAYITELERKLTEEIAEYQQDKNLEEMADVLEVLYAICEAKGYTIEQLEEKGKEKFKERGGFKDKIYLEYVK
jgi:predicted house-cleaning noncanonical NTP pyrophosphatase (MazG superfamily)